MKNKKKKCKKKKKEALGGKFIALKYIYKKRKWAEKPVI